MMRALTSGNVVVVLVVALTLTLAGCAPGGGPSPDTTPSGHGTIDAAEFTTFFERQATLLDELQYTAGYLVDGASVIVQRTPDQLSATFARTDGDVVLRLSSEAATLCRPSAAECTGIDAWLDDPVGVAPPVIAGHDAAFWWDLFTATGAHDPSTVAFIPQVTTAEEGRTFFTSSKDLPGVGSVECAGYRRSRSTGADITWCFTADGVWASGPSDRSVLTSLTLG